MLVKIVKPDPKLLSDLSEVTRSSTALAKYTGEDRGDLRLYKNGDGSRTFLRVCETIPATEHLDKKNGAVATYEFALFEVLAPATTKSIAPSILEAK